MKIQGHVLHKNIVLFVTWAAAIAKRDWEGAKKLISEEVVFAHSISGTPSDCRKRLKEFIDGGLYLPILLPMGTQEARRKVVELVRDL